MPTVSILMSNYNTNAAYLRKALDSVLAQTFSDFEVILIDDGSADGSPDILREYTTRDARIRLFENPGNMGLASSLNRGLSLCEGTYIARFDTDDICYPDRLEKQVAFMDEHPELVLCGAWADVFEDDENVTLKQWQPRMRPYEEYRIRLLFGNDPLIIHPSVMFRRAMLEQAHIRYDTDKQYRYSEDYRMWVLCSEVGPIGILEYPVIRYRNAVSDERITIRHAEGMKECTYRVQKEQYRRLGIDLTPDLFELNNRLLQGRKPYDPAYRDWIKLIIRQNRKHRLYDQATLKHVLRDRWYTITYYGIAYEKNAGKRLRYFFGLDIGNQARFIREVVFHGHKQQAKPSGQIS